jgi:hypothetical protein
MYSLASDSRRAATGLENASHDSVSSARKLLIRLPQLGKQDLLVAEIDLSGEVGGFLQGRQLGLADLLDVGRDGGLDRGRPFQGAKSRGAVGAQAVHRGEREARRIRDGHDLAGRRQAVVRVPRPLRQHDDHEKGHQRDGRLQQRIDG